MNYLFIMILILIIFISFVYGFQYFNIKKRKKIISLYKYLYDFLDYHDGNRLELRVLSNKITIEIELNTIDSKKEFIFYLDEKYFGKKFNDIINIIKKRKYYLVKKIKKGKDKFGIPCLIIKLVCKSGNYSALIYQSIEVVKVILDSFSIDQNVAFNIQYIGSPKYEMEPSER